LSWTTFDIETGPLPDDVLEELCPPFDRELITSEFNAAGVKTSHLKDPQKITDKIESAKQAHAADQAAKIAKYESDKFSHFDNFKADAALDAATGRVLLVATCDCDTMSPEFMEGDECDIISAWWEFVAVQKSKRSGRLAGLNIFDFDLPFLVKRSWILGVKVPSFVIDFSSKWMNPDPVFFDIRNAWQCGNRQSKSNFDWIGRAMGTGGKIAGDHGAEFAALYARDRETALQYAANDVIQPAMWLAKMGFVATKSVKSTPKPTKKKEVKSVNSTLNSTLDDI
jgi:hypothetical protein